MVQGAVARKDFVPALTHFRITGGRIEGFNGLIAISTPTDLAVEAYPKAASFVRAIERIPEDASVVLNLTQAGRLSVKAGKYKAYVECMTDITAYPDIQPEGELVEIKADLMAILKKLAPFMGQDASRAWSRGILLKGQSAFATNNIVLVEHWMEIPSPVEICIPAEAVKEMLRIRMIPTHMQIAERSATFHYENGAWLRTALGSLEWPPLAPILDQDCAPQPINTGLFDALERLDVFAEQAGRVYFRDGVVSTSPVDGEGAEVELDGFAYKGCFNLLQFSSLSGIATQIDLERFPLPCLFFGDMLRGAIIGFKA